MNIKSELVNAVDFVILKGKKPVFHFYSGMIDISLTKPKIKLQTVLL